MKSSVDVHNFLQLKGIKHEIFLINTPAMSSERASAVLGIELEKISKTIMFLSEGKPYLIILPGDSKVSYKKLKKLIKRSRVRLATPEELIDLTEYSLGATPPVGFNKEIKIIIDERVIKNEIVYTGSGDVTSILKLKAEDLKKVTGAKVADVSSRLKVSN